MQTIKLPYKTEDKSLIFEYQKQYSNCLHFMYNRVNDGFKETTIKHLTINNISLLDSWFKQTCVKEALQINASNKNKKVIFGGKYNFIQRCKGYITKEQYKINKLSSLYSIGEGTNPSVKGNRKFHLESNLKTIIFKPNRNTKVELTLPNLRSNLLKTLSKLYNLQEQHKISISYKINQNFIYIIFDETILANVPIKTIDNRILSMDLNPNYIGWSIIDWKDENEFNIIDKGVYSIKSINDKEKEFKQLNLNYLDYKRINLNNKRKFETLQISKELISKAIHYKVETISVENLDMKSSDKEKGRDYNKLVNNNWLRNILVNNLNKHCNLHHIKLIKVKPEYSSFIGNILFRNLNLPDMVLSSIELSRRAYEFNLQYLKKTKNKKKNIIFPDLDLYKNQLEKSLEELNLVVKDLKWKDLYYFLKNSKIKYRVPLDQWFKVLSLKHIKSNINCYQFI